MMRAFLVACLMATPCVAEPYQQVSGGCIKSTDQENSDEIEFGSECGGLLAWELGNTFEYDGFDFQVAGEVTYRWKDLHGQNGNGKRSADGETLHVGSVLANGGASLPLLEWIDIYLLGGLGFAYLNGLGDDDWAPAWQVESGFRIDAWERFSASLGYRYFEVDDVELDGNESTPDFHGVVLGVRWWFGH